jgi:hypothetical protein
MREAGFETRQLMQYLRDCHDRNEFASYAQMSALINVDVLKKRHYLANAIFILKRDYGKHFLCITGEGYRPLSNDEILTQRVPRRVQTVRAEIQRARSDFGSVSYRDLKPEQMQTYIKQGLQLECMELTASADVEEAIGSVVKPSNYEVAENPITWMKRQNLLELLGGIS